MKQSVFSKPQKLGEIKDLGFGTASSVKRSLNKNGSFNVERRGISFLKSLEPYHILISMSWLKFSIIVLLFYVAMNLIFATLYTLIGVEHLSGIDGTTAVENFFEAFFFSSQTVTTLGYGRVAPIGIAASTIAAIESMIGLLGFALVTGLLYGRFSRPIAKIIYSNNAVIAPYKGITAFEFRMVNQRSNQLIEVEVEVILSMADKVKNTRIFESVNLERTKINFFPLSWTVVHPIDESSPLYGISKEDFESADIEFIILVKAFDDTFSQTVYSRFSYSIEEIVWGAKFVGIIGLSSNGMRTLDIDKLDAIEKVELNTVVNT